MTRCNITVTTRVVNPQNLGSVAWDMLPQESVARCVTHGFDMDARAGVGIATLCPIGKIEEATEKALKEIDEALKVFER